MEYKDVKLNSYNVHFIKTDKFKTIDIKIVFTDEFCKEEITKRNFLIDVLSSSTKKYNTRRKLNIKCQDLYSLNLQCSNYRLGNYLISKMGISFLNPKYTEKSMLGESIDLLSEVIFNPNVNKQKFDSRTFNLVKKDLENEILTIKEQPKLYATTRFFEVIGENKPYAYHGYCYLDDLKKINESDLYAYYQKFIKKNMVDIYVVGDFDFDEVLSLLREKIKITTFKKKKCSMVIHHNKIRKRLRKVIEKSNFKQAKLIIGLKLSDLSEFEFNYVSSLYNLILGGISDSLLMRNVRLKESLAYYANSSLNKADNLIIINSGIESSNFSKTLKIIKKTLKDIQNGKITDDDILKAKTEYLSSLNLITNLPGGLIDLQIANNLGLSESFETRKERIVEVTKEDIIRFSQKISLDTVYLLEGNNEGI